MRTRNDSRFFAALRMTTCVAALTNVCRFRNGGSRYATMFVCFTEELSDHVFHRHFLHVDIADVAGLEKSSAGLCNLRPWNLQLHRDGCLFGDFAKRRQITCLFLVESKTQNLITRETIDDLCQRTIEKYVAVIDH